MDKKNYLLKFALLNIVAVISIDQITKTAITSTYRMFETKVIVPNLFNLTYLLNPGASFSILADAAPWLRIPFFMIVPTIAMIIIFLLLKKSSTEESVSKEKKLEVLSFSLILGGALGNFIDRLHHQGFAVVDFLQFHYKNHYWPTLNVADIAITAGIILLFFSMVLKDKNKKRTNVDETGRRL